MRQRSASSCASPSSRAVWRRSTRAGAELTGAFGDPKGIGRLLLTDYLVAFEAASFLLLLAAVGAVVLARRRRGLEDMASVGPRSEPPPSREETLEVRV